ncbi:MAG: DUF6178 family protein [Desulfomonilaceae bacterium]
MENYGLVIHDEQSFIAKVVERGVQRGELAREKADEIVRISVAMANKYVLQKEIDFRSLEQLAKVQQTVMRLVGIGLEMKSEGDISEGIAYLNQLSPVDLFRLAYTRISNLRREWRKLLLEDRIQILVNQKDYECLSELACDTLSKMSVFTEAEIYTIKSLTLEDDLFTSLTVLEYYESELKRYQFILRLKEILPFGHLNRSPTIRAENLSEVDSIREALINTLAISTHVEAQSPISLSVEEIRQFLNSIDWKRVEDPFPDEIESAVIEVIHELGRDLAEDAASQLAKEVIRTVQKMVMTILNDWQTINSPSSTIFFKRWQRIAILSDRLDELDQLVASAGGYDEFDFENLIERLSRVPEKGIAALAPHLSWRSLMPEQVIRLFHDMAPYQKVFSKYVYLNDFTGPQLIDLLEIIDADSLKTIVPKVREALAGIPLEFEDLKALLSIPGIERYELAKDSATPQIEREQALIEFKDGGPRIRRILFHACRNAKFFRDLFFEAWAMDPQFVKKETKSLSASEIGPFLKLLSGDVIPKIFKNQTAEPHLEFESEELNNFYKSLPATKKKAASRFFANSVQ